MTIQSKICPKCQYENSLDANVCSQCGAALPNGGIETLRVSDMLPDITTPPKKPVQYGQAHPGSIAFYILGDSTPLLVADKGRITLGRSAANEPTPTVNFTPYRANLLGVSRCHAAVYVSDEGRSLVDLHSSNGTWVNEERLTPAQPRLLHSGDLVRLGHLLLHIYFQDTLEGNAEPEPHALHSQAAMDGEGDIHAATITLVGRPGRVERQPNHVIAHLRHRTTPAPGANGEAASTLYRVQITASDWERVQSALTAPQDALRIEGTCAYDPERAGILVHAASVTVTHWEATAPAKKTSATTEKQPTEEMPKTQPLGAPPSRPDDETAKPAPPEQKPPTGS